MCSTCGCKKSDEKCCPECSQEPCVCEDTKEEETESAETPATTPDESVITPEETVAEDEEDVGKMDAEETF